MRVYRVRFDYISANGQKGSFETTLDGEDGVSDSITAINVATGLFLGSISVDEEPIDISIEVKLEGCV